MVNQKTIYEDDLCERVNKIIKEAIIHGGDSGGAYYDNYEGLMKAMTEFLEHYKLDGYVIIDETGCGPNELRFAKKAKAKNIIEKIQIKSSNEEKVGVWQVKPFYPEGFEGDESDKAVRIRCSSCGFKMIATKFGNPLKYCPNCGSKNERRDNA